MRSAVLFETHRTAYCIEDVADRAMTVRELIDLLSGYDGGTLVLMSNDNGYTYGNLNRWEFWDADEDEDGDWEEYK